MSDERPVRRLAAIMAADVVGYSRLMRDDEAGTLAQLKTLRRELLDPKVVAHNGRIVKTTGDGVLVEFLSAVNAVRHAVEVQRAMAQRNADVPDERRMELRMGINVGDVIVDGDDIFGDGVNIAARLEGLAAPGGVCISGSAHEQVRHKLDLAFEDLGEQSVKNIDEPVRVWRVAIGGPESSAQAEPTLELPDKPSIAVLPFDNMSGDPDQTYFSDGITEDIITELSRFRSLFVIARNSSFAFRGESIDVTEVGRKLGVQYVVEGSVRKAGNRVRVTVQLIDAATGRHLWAERYDRDLEDIFAVQDQITEAIVATLPGRLEEAARDRAERKPTSNMTAYDYQLLGTQRLWRWTPDDIVEAGRLAQMAVDLDPRFARAQALITATHLWAVPLQAGKEGALDEALRHAEIAVALDEEDSWSRAMMGLTLFELRKDEEAEGRCRRAVALNPNDADANAILGNNMVYYGRIDEGREWIVKAMRLNPYPPSWYYWYRNLLEFSLRNYDEAARCINRIRPLDRWHRAYLAACYARLGRMDEARAEIAIFVEARRKELEARGEPMPGNTIELAAFRANRYRRPEDRDHLLDSLRLAGLTG